jgi:hypothetical protein
LVLTDDRGGELVVELAARVGSLRDQRTVTSPIFGSRSLPPGVMAKRALRVNRIACRLSLRERNRGGPTFGPLRLPSRAAKKLRKAVVASARACCSTTADTSQSQARSGWFLASVITMRDSSASDRNGRPCWRVWSRRAMASLNTTRAQPNALASAIRWPGVGSSR